MRNSIESESFEAVFEREAVQVSSPSPVSSQELVQRVHQLGGRTFHAFTPKPEEQVGFLAHIAGGLSGKRILDAGCASGTTTLFATVGDPTYYGQPEMVIGIDYDVDSINVAKRIATRYHGKEDASSTPVLFLAADLENLSRIPDNSVDIVHASIGIPGAITKSMYREFLRITRDGGILNVTFTDLVLLQKTTKISSKTSVCLETLQKYGGGKLDNYDAFRVRKQPAIR